MLVAMPRECIIVCETFAFLIEFRQFVDNRSFPWIS